MSDEDAKLRDGMAEPADRFARLRDAQLQWEADGAPYSARFGDVYFSRDGGLAEKRHVFLKGCGLPEGWAGRRRFTIGELGFGTGLNFLAAWQAWHRTAAPGAILHYIAVEGFPLRRDEIGASARPWPELEPYAAALARVYPEPQPGFHRIFPSLAPGSFSPIALTLLWGEVQPMLEALEAEIDAWYLDGFSPERNPAMWSQAVLQELARLSGRGTRLATYTAAGHVRRGLVDAGFTVARAPGYGRKREMLTARYPRPNAAPAEPWFAPPEPISSGHAAIIGGGIAGASVAQALRRRGFTTTIVDRRNTLAAEASGNPLAIAMPRLTAGPALDGAFYAQAWPFAQRLWSALGAQDFSRRCGVLQLATGSADDARQALIAESGILPASMLRAVSAAEASDIAGCAVPVSALYFPQGSTIAPRGFCAAMAAGMEIVLDADVVALDRGDDGCHLRGHNGVIARANVVVLANAGGVRAFASGLPLQGRRGQITAAPPTQASAKLRCVLSYGGAITPVFGDTHYLGATFDHAREDETDLEVRADDHRRNLAELARVMPDLLADGGASALSGCAAVRWATPDHLALAGPVADEDAYRTDYAGLHHGRHWLRYPRARYVPGLFVLSGLGAHGLVTAPLAAEVLACAICGEPSPLPRALTHALHPARFLVRALKRK